VSAVRGPSGVAPFPPASLASTKLPIDILPAETPLYRAHPTTHGPIFFGPGPCAPATYRFDSASGAFGVLYVALGLAAALVETLLRNPRRKMVALADIEMRATSVLRCRRDLQVVRLHGAGCRSSASTIPSRRALRTVRRLCRRALGASGGAGRPRLPLPARSRRDLLRDFRASCDAV
jgi:hypothetical protein